MFTRRWEGLLGRRASILLTDEVTPPPALVRAGLKALLAIIRTNASASAAASFEFFTASIRNRNTRMAYARGKRRSGIRAA